MNIVFITHRYWPVVGGVEIYMQRLAAALLRMGHRVTVITGRSQTDLAERQTHEHVTIHRFPALRSPWRARAWFLRNLRLLRQADVIHVSNTHMLEYFWRMVGPLVDRRRVFLTRHGMSYKFPVPDSERRRAVRSLQLANGVVHDGEFIGKWLGVKPDLCPDQGLWPTTDQLPSVDEPPPTTAVFIGRMEPDSGIRTYVDAVRILAKEQNLPFELRAYGSGSLADELRSDVAREDLPVRFFGRTENAQGHVPESCFAFIDGRMAIQEAMARRRLVFAAYADRLKRDYVAGEAFSPHIIPVASADELVNRLRFFIDHPEQRLALVDRAYQHTRKLTWTRTAQAYLQFWQQRLSKPVSACSRLNFLRLLAELSYEPRRPKNTWARYGWLPIPPKYQRTADIRP